MGFRAVTAPLRGGHRVRPLVRNPSKIRRVLELRGIVEQLGVSFRPMAEALRDTIRWLYEAGEISAKIAGQIANNRTR